MHFSNVLDCGTGQSVAHRPAAASLILYVYVACLDTCKCFLTFVYQLDFIPIKLFIHSFIHSLLSVITFTCLCLLLILDKQHFPHFLTL